MSVVCRPRSMAAAPLPHLCRRLRPQPRCRPSRALAQARRRPPPAPDLPTTLLHAASLHQIHRRPSCTRLPGCGPSRRAAPPGEALKGTTPPREAASRAPSVPVSRPPARQSSCDEASPSSSRNSYVYTPMVCHIGLKNSYVYYMYTLSPSLAVVPSRRHTLNFSPKGISSVLTQIEGTATTSSQVMSKTMQVVVRNCRPSK